MRTVDLIHRKRDGEELSGEEIAFLIDGYTNGAIPDYQASAFLMAVFFSGMTDREVSALTERMAQSGETVDLSSVPGVKVDKHSTGGVGDKTSMIASPLAAAAGAVVPMISGRALGHTGGTLDKLESIPGFRTNLTIDNCTFTNNVSNDADGGAVLFIVFNSSLPTCYGVLNVTNSTFTGNSVIFPGPGTSNGGALTFT
jgi:thymidine phosphorylase